MTEKLTMQQADEIARKLNISGQIEDYEEQDDGHYYFTDDGRQLHVKFDGSWVLYDMEGEVLDQSK